MVSFRLSTICGFPIPHFAGVAQFRAGAELRAPLKSVILNIRQV
jgi:hypothetical protein